MINDKKNMDNFNNNNLYNQKTNLKKDKNKLNFKKLKSLNQFFQEQKNLSLKIDLLIHVY